MNWESALTMSPDEMRARILNMGTAGVVWMIIFTIILSLPPVLVLLSKRSSGGAKFGWFMLTSLFSWLAYVLFLVFTRPPANGGVEVNGAVDN